MTEIEKKLLDLKFLKETKDIEYICEEMNRRLNASRDQNVKIQPYQEESNYIYIGPFEESYGQIKNQDIIEYIKYLNKINIQCSPTPHNN